MEGATAVAAAPSSDPYMEENDVISFHSDSSGDTNLQTALEQQFSDDKSKQISTPPRRHDPSDHREDVPNDTPPQKRKDRRRHRPVSLKEDLSPIPYSWYHSKRDYSPSVSSVTPRAKTISSWMEAIMRTPKGRHAKGEEIDNDDDSIDSVEQLEQVAAQIRSEIRQAELQELADEAESAAEAGQESFAGRASTFGDSSHSLGYSDLNGVNPKQQYKLRRYTTYSEGTSLLKQAALRPVRRTQPKIRCLQLRDINEVIPSFGELHLHLKKHLVLSGVEEKSLEIDVTNTEKEDSRPRAPQKKGKRTPVQFLSSLKSWVSTSSARSRSSVPQSPSTDVASDVTTPRKTTAQRSNKPVLDSLEADTVADECSESTFASHVSKEETYEVGGRLSGHLHAPKAVTRSSIRIPTGLDIPQDLRIPNEMPPKMVLLHDVDRTDVDTVDTVPTSSSSQEGQANKDDKRRPGHELEEFEPIALFQHVGDDASSAGGGGQSAGTGSSSNSIIMQPVSPKENAGERWAESLGPNNMFITPMRLRGIRRDSRRLGFDRSLSHRSDLGWRTLKSFRRTGQTFSDSNLPADDDRLNLPILSVKSDGEYSACPPVSLNHSKDESAVSLPEDISFFHRDETSLSLSGPPLFADDKQELSQVVESSGSMVAELDRPKSLSFDEHDVVGIALQDFLKDINNNAPVEENLFGGCLDDSSGNCIALQSKLSGDDSDNIAECNESNVTVAAPASMDVLDTKKNVDELVNVVEGGREVSRPPTEKASLDESLPLMPTLDKIDEQQHAKDTDESNGTEGEEKLHLPSEQLYIPKIEQRSICMNDVSVILEAEADNVSLHSLDVSNLFSSEVEAEDSCLLSGAMNGDALHSTEHHDAEVPLQRSEPSDPVSEFYAKEEAFDTENGIEKEGFPCEEIGPLDPVSEFYASELTFDPVVDTRSTTDLEGAESENDEQCKTEEIKLSQLSQNIEEGADIRDVGEHVTSLGDLPSEVKSLNESSSDIIHRYQQGVKTRQAPSRCLKREEILKSPSGAGRVKVTIELSLHDDDTDSDDDDDVRSEGTSVHTPQAHPCECLINAATRLEENVRDDIANARECTRIRYGLQADEEHIEAKSSLPRPDHQVSSPTRATNESPPRKTAVRQNQQTWSPMRRTLSCPSILNLTEEEVDTSVISSATMPIQGLALAQRKATTIHHRSLTEGREYFHAYSMLDPCQSTSPFKDTMDDMMKSFSPTTEFEMERNAILQAHENYEFLSNYMYSSKPIGEANADTREGNMCGDHCGYLSDVLDSYRSFIPMRSTSNKVLSLNARGKSHPSSATNETWFDVASEHFDGALEKVMGRAHAQSKRWNSMFRAPGLKSKSDIEKASTSRNNGVKGIVLVKQSSSLDSKLYNGEVSEQQFESLYGLPREEFEQLPVTERSILHDKAHKNLRRQASAPLQVGLEPPSPAISTRSLSSSDLAMTGGVRI